jgi:hypothetical protein
MTILSGLMGRSSELEGSPSGVGRVQREREAGQGGGDFQGSR